MIAMLDDPRRLPEIRDRVERKRSLKSFYEKVYREYVACLSRCPSNGLVLEVGTGAGFGKAFIPELITSDILPYDGVDLVLDARKLPFSNESVRLICMTSVFHHISNVEAFLREAQRCLVPRGRILIVDQHVGYISTPILKYLHTEGFSPHAAEWEFSAGGPLSGANGALAWIVFVRDLSRFRRLYPCLRLDSYQCHMPLLYWLSGGLRPWNLLPSWSLGGATWLDRQLLRCSPQFGSWAFIDVVKTAAGRESDHTESSTTSPTSNSDGGALCGDTAC